jgi:DNA mismatch repair ATPase MutS
MTRLLGKITNNLPEMELKLAMEALSCLIKYLELMGDEGNFGQFTMKRLDLSQFMHLDSAAIDSLKLVASKRDGQSHCTYSSPANECACSQQTDESLLAAEQVQYFNGLTRASLLGQTTFA